MSAHGLENAGKPLRLNARLDPTPTTAGKHTQQTMETPHSKEPSARAARKQAQKCRVAVNPEGPQGLGTNDHLTSPTILLSATGPHRRFTGRLHCDQVSDGDHAVA
jgi:hypothetical protein